MFVQVIKAHTADTSGFLQHASRWETELRPGAPGYLGGTVGVADDGTVVMFIRFEDEASAQANAARPEQTAFFEEGAKFFDVEPTFRESSDVQTILDGPSDAASFVQVMEGKALDRAKAAAMETPELLDELRKARPDLLGVIRAWFAGDEFAEAAYFTSEGEARKGESSADFDRAHGDMDALFGAMTYTDLRTLVK